MPVAKTILYYLLSKFISY